MSDVWSNCRESLTWRQLLASAGNDETVRVWDLATGSCSMTVPVYHLAYAIAQIHGLLAIGLSAGLLIVDIDVSKRNRKRCDHDRLPKSDTA